MSALFSGLVELSKVVESFVAKLSRNLPLLCGCIALTAFLALTHPDEQVRYYSSAVGTFLVTYLIFWRWVDSRKRSHAKWDLKHLAEDERVVLRRYLKENRSVCYFPAFHGPVRSLIAKNILTDATTTIPHIDAPVVIQPFARIHLQQHPELIDLKHGDIGSVKLSDDLNERDQETPLN